jgi:hypothetical protein
MAHPGRLCRAGMIAGCSALWAFCCVRVMSERRPIFHGSTPSGIDCSGGRKIATVGAVLIAASAFVQTADAQQSWRPLPNDPEQFRMIEECLELTFGRSGGKETARMYEACLDRQLAA